MSSSPWRGPRSATRSTGDGGPRRRTGRRCRRPKLDGPPSGGDRAPAPGGDDLHLGAPPRRPRRGASGVRRPLRCRRGLRPAVPPGGWTGEGLRVHRAVRSAPLRRAGGTQQLLAVGGRRASRGRSRSPAATPAGPCAASPGDNTSDARAVRRPGSAGRRCRRAQRSHRGPGALHRPPRSADRPRPRARQRPQRGERSAATGGNGWSGGEGTSPGRHGRRHPGQDVGSGSDRTHAPGLLRGEHVRRRSRPRRHVHERLRRAGRCPTNSSTRAGSTGSGRPPGGDTSPGVGAVPLGRRPPLRRRTPGRRPP